MSKFDLKKQVFFFNWVCMQNKLCTSSYDRYIYSFFLAYQECGICLILNKASGVLINGVSQSYPFLSSSLVYLIKYWCLSIFHRTIWW